MHTKDVQRLGHAHTDFGTPKGFVRKPAAGVACTALELQRCVIKGGGWACISKTRSGWTTRTAICVRLELLYVSQRLG